MPDQQQDSSTCYRVATDHVSRQQVEPEEKKLITQFSSSSFSSGALNSLVVKNFSQSADVLQVLIHDNSSYNHLSQTATKYSITQQRAEQRWLP